MGTNLGTVAEHSGTGRVVRLSENGMMRTPSSGPASHGKNFFNKNFQPNEPLVFDGIQMKVRPVGLWPYLDGR